MHDVGCKDHVRKKEEDEVEEPEAENRHRSEDIKTDIGAARLDGVADKPFLLVTEEGETSQQEHQQAENQHQRPPCFTCGGRLKQFQFKSGFD